jgi:hypothetical protein
MSRASAVLTLASGLLYGRDRVSRHGRALYASAANVRSVTLTLYPGVSGRRQLAA